MTLTEIWTDTQTHSCMGKDPLAEQSSALVVLSEGSFIGGSYSWVGVPWTV